MVISSVHGIRRVAILTLLLAVVLFMSSCASLKKSDESSFQVKEATIQSTVEDEAEEALLSGNYKKSSELYSHLVSEAPDNVIYQIKYADSLRFNGKYADSRDVYGQILKYKNDFIPAKEGIGLSYAAEGKFEEALYYFNEVIKNDASQWRTINAVGVIYSLLDRGDDAKEYFDAAIEVNKNNPTILNNIGLFLALRGDYVSGIKALVKADSITSSTEEVKKRKIENNLALVYGISGNMDEAERVLKRYNNDAVVYNNLGFYAKLANNSSLAETYLSKALSASPVFYKKAWDSMEAIKTASLERSDDYSSPSTHDLLPQVPLPILRSRR